MQKNLNSKIPPLWMTSNVNKKRFSVTIKGNNYFLLLDDKSKQRCKVKLNFIQGYDLYQIKKEELSGNISKLQPVQLHSQLITFYFH